MHPRNARADRAADSPNITLSSRGREEFTFNGTAEFTSLQLKGTINQSYGLQVRPAGASGAPLGSQRGAGEFPDTGTASTANGTCWGQRAARGGGVPPYRRTWQSCWGMLFFPHACPDSNGHRG